MWTQFLRGLAARGLSGVRLVTSLAHGGLQQAISAVLACAHWQRCRTHFMRNLLAKVPRHAQPLVASLVRTIFAQERATDAWAQHGRVVDQLSEHGFADAAGLLADAADDALAYTALPKAVWPRVWSNNPRNGSTRKSAAAPTWSASSPTEPRSSDGWERSSPSSTTNGRSAGATCPSLLTPLTTNTDDKEDERLLAATA